MNRAQLVIELVVLAEQAHEHRSAFAKHGAFLLIDAADYIAESQDGHARISLRVAERVLGESHLAYDVQQLHDALVELLLEERQHGPIPPSLFEPRKRAPRADRYAEFVTRSVNGARAWTDADDVAALAEAYS